MIDVIDVRDRAIVWTHLGQKSKLKNFIECIDRAIKYIQGSKYKGTNGKDRQWSTIQIKSDRSIH